MRISDWSSDVCSSDLGRRETRSARHVRTLRRIGLVDRVGQRDKTHDAARCPRARPRRREGLLPVAARDDRMHGSRFVKAARSEEHTSELQSLMRNAYAVFRVKKKNKELMNRATAS